MNRCSVGNNLEFEGRHKVIDSKTREKE